MSQMTCTPRNKIQASATKPQRRAQVPSAVSILEEKSREPSWIGAVAIIIGALLVFQFLFMQDSGWQARSFAQEIEPIPEEPIPADNVERIMKFHGRQITVTGKLFAGTGRDGKGNTLYLSFSPALGEGLALALPLEAFKDETVNSLTLRMRRYGDRNVKVQGLVGSDRFAPALIWIKSFDQIKTQ